jgi:glycosyltransferase involved in cell wall biosynthesis
MHEFKHLRIAQIAPLVEPIPPLTYGGTERVLAALTKRLVMNGNMVILFASGNSDPYLPSALVSGYQTSLREAKETGKVDFNIYESNAVTEKHIKMAYARALDFGVDIIHSHFGLEDLDYAAEASKKIAVIKTIHGLLTPADLRRYQKAQGVGLVSISDDQMRDDFGVPYTTTYKRLNHIGRVYNGLDLRHSKYSYDPGEYLAAGGRFSPEKGIDRAINVAKKADIRIKVFGKVDADTGDKEYYEAKIKPMVDNRQVEFLGELNQQERDELIAGAMAYVHLARWREPFGLMMAEAGANGCPVIGINLGSVPEIVEHGVTGFVVETEEEAINAAKNIDLLKRDVCRARTLKKFNDRIMAREYQELISQTLAKAA